MKRKPPKRRKKQRKKKAPEDFEDFEVFEAFHIELTFEDNFNPYTFEITHEIADAINKYRVMSKKHPEKAARELPAVIGRFPEVPIFKNHLFMALQLLGHSDEAWALNEQINKDHPDYFYGVLNKATYHWQKGDYDKVEELLGGSPLNIKKSFPKRKLFHFTEFYAYYSFLIRFWLSKDMLEAAQSHYKMVEEALPNHPGLPELKKLIDTNSLIHSLEDRLKKLEKPQKLRKPRKK